MKIGMVGCGELGSQVLLHLSQKEKGFQAVLFDDILAAEKKNDALPFSSFADKRYEDLMFYVGLGYKHLVKRREVFRALLDLKRNLPVFIHHTGFVNQTAQLHSGTIIYPMCNVDKNVVIHSGVLLNNSVTVSHDTVIGSSSYLSPGVILSGNVSIGECSFLGSGTVVSNNISIGSHVVIGAGTVVTADVPDHSVVIGNPMKFLKQPLKIV